MPTIDKPWEVHDDGGGFVAGPFRYRGDAEEYIDSANRALRRSPGGQDSYRPWFVWHRPYDAAYAVDDGDGPPEVVVHRVTATPNGEELGDPIARALWDPDAEYPDDVLAGMGWRTVGGDPWTPTPFGAVAEVEPTD